MSKILKEPSTEFVTGSEKSAKVETLSETSVFARMIDTKKILKAYLRGEVTLSELESMGIEVG
jgi:hypothetical protein